MSRRLFSPTVSGTEADLSDFEKASRFLCYGEDDRGEYAECCGYNLEMCINNDKTKIRRQGGILHTIKEFPCTGSTTHNCAFMLASHLIEDPAGDFFYDLMEESYTFSLEDMTGNSQQTASQTVVRDWSDYESFDFFIAFSSQN